MQMCHSRVGLCLVAAWIVAWMGACAGRGKSAESVSLSAINDKNAKTSDQIAAIRRAWSAADAGETDRKSVRESLKRAAWARGSWAGVRVAAIEELLKDTANIEDARGMFCFMLPTETHWQVIEKIGDESTARGWKEMATPLVRSWSRPVTEPPDDKRPERRALAGLYPEQPVEETVFQVFIGAAPRSCQPLRDRDRQDAWSLLRRVDRDGARSLALLRQEPRQGENADPMIEAMRAAARDLHVVPQTGEQVAWVQRLRTQDHAEFWREAAAAVAKLNDEQAEGLALRHVAALRWASEHRPDWLAMNRAGLVAQVRSEMQGRSRHQRPVAATDVGGSGETLTRWEPVLAWGDLLSVLIAMEITSDPGVADSLFKQADEDHKDRSTEHGGVVFGRSGGGFEPAHFPPRPTQRMGDRRFVASTDMIDAGATALFHYHFHANDYKNADYAGPSRDDLDYSDRQGAACLVFTFASRGVLNADYYQPGGAVLDLGELRRPPAR